MKFRTLLAATAAAALLSITGAFAADYLGGAVKSADVGGKMVLTDAKGMTLYIWDKDAVGVSNCYDQCAVNWPPILVPTDTAVEGEFTLVDRKDKMTPETFEEARGAFRRDGTDPLELIEARSNAEVDRVYEEFLGLLEALKERGITNVVFDPTIARGFLYYTGLIFEVFDTNPENPRALLGGGRYDGLVSLFGGEPIPAVGFAIGIETLIDFLRTHDLLPAARPGADLFIGTPNESDIAAAHALADALRAEGANVLVSVSEKSLGDQVREAVRRGIPYFLAAGEAEAASGRYKVKELATGTETELSAGEVAAFVS